MKYTDNTIMPFGKYHGEKLANVPANYLIYLYDSKTANPELREYIEENLDVLRFEMKAVKNENHLSSNDAFID